MGAHISVTGRPAITEIEKFSLRAPVVPIYNTSGAKRSVGVTVWAFNFFDFIIKSSPPKTRRRRRNDVFLGIN